MLVEFVLEAVFQLLIEVFGDALASMLDTRLGRLVLGAALGLAGGVGWGWYVGSRQDTIPATLWIALAFAVAGAFASVALRGAVRPAGDDAHNAFGGGLLPWRWGAARWETFALLNVFVALGVWVGFSTA